MRVLLFLVSLLALATVSRAELSLNAKRGLDLYRRVFSSRKGPEFTPQETLEHLREIREDFAGCEDKMVKIRAGVVENLLQVAESDTTKCDQSRLDEFQRFVESHKEFEVNVLPYLHHHLGARAKICGKKTGQEPQVSYVGLRSKPKKEEKDWQTNHYQIYAGSDGKKLAPERTQELIRELNEIYADQTDASTNGRKSKIRALFLASEINESNCSRRYFDELQKLLIANGIFSTNVLPYLYHLKAKQADFCEAIIEKSLHETIEKLPHEIEESLRMLRGLIDEAQEFLNKQQATLRPRLASYDPSKYLARALLNYLSIRDRDEFKLLLNKRADQRRAGLKSLLQRHVNPMCQTVARQLAPFEFIFTDGLIHYMDGEVRQWLRYERTCELLLHQPQLLLHEMQALTKAARKKFSYR